MFPLSESPHEDEQPDSVLLASLLITLVRGDSRVRSVGCKQQIEEMREAVAAQLASGAKDGTPVQNVAARPLCCIPRFELWDVSGPVGVYEYIMGYTQIVVVPGPLV